MDNKALNTKLRSEAIYLGICEKGLKEWEEDMTDAELIAFGFRNIDFLLKHHWPANDTIKTSWPKDFLRMNAVFVDDKYSINNAEHSLILGNSDITMRYNGWAIGVVCVRDGSKLSVTAKNKSHIIIHAFDNADINADGYDNASITVIRHSEDIRVSTFCQNHEAIKVKDELGYLK